MPGCHSDTNVYMVLMNVMCDMSQFVVVFPVPDESSAILVSYFVQYVLTELILCHLVVLDHGTTLKESSSQCVKF